MNGENIVDFPERNKTTLYSKVREANSCKSHYLKFQHHAEKVKEEA